jgi:hypothetical protein
MLKKIANTIEMSFEIPDAEKSVAEEADEWLYYAANALKLASDHLDILYEPLKKHPSVSVESVVERRGVLNRYKQKVKENYNRVKEYVLHGIQKLNYFSNDSGIVELTNSLISSVEDVEQSVVLFLDVLSDYKAEGFRENSIRAIEGVKKQSAQAEGLIRDRIIDYIDTNILTKSWMNESSVDLDIDIQEKVPLITELFNERQEALEGRMPEMATDGQRMNASDSARPYYPGHARTMNIGEEY